jgi:hypothetical protein
MEQPIGAASGLVVWIPEFLVFCILAVLTTGTVLIHNSLLGAVPRERPNDGPKKLFSQAFVPAIFKRD